MVAALEASAAVATALVAGLGVEAAGVVRVAEEGKRAVVVALAELVAHNGEIHRGMILGTS